MTRRSVARCWAWTIELLLDTHHVFWFGVEPEKLTAAERDLLDTPTTDVIVSAVSIWELQLKWHRFHRSGDRKGPVDPQDLFDRLSEAKIECIALAAAHAAARLHQDIAHGDPFDRMLLLQAQETGAQLLSRDSLLKGHPLVVQL